MKTEKSKIQREWDEYNAEQSRALEICANCGHKRDCHGDWAGECFRCPCQQFTKDTAERTPLSSSDGRLQQAKRFALMNYDHWNEVTGFPAPHTSYYYEIASIIEDAVEFGFGVAHGQNWKTIVRRLKRDGD